MNFKTKIRLLIHKLRKTKGYIPDNPIDFYNEFYFEKQILNLNVDDYIIE